MRTILVFTATRAEYGLLRPVLRGLRERADVRLQVLASGAHLSPAHGMTVGEIEADGFTIDARVEMLLDSDSARGTCSAMGLGLIGYGQELARLRPDLVVLLGDRFETLAMASACLVSAVPVAHIHGGEATFGAVDEAARHAVTKMSLLHFTSTEAYRRRVIQLGEAPERVFNVGALGVENIARLAPRPRGAVAADLGLDPGLPYLMVTHHPVTLNPGGAAAEFGALLEALEGLGGGMQVVFTGANADPGGGAINAMTAAFVAGRRGRAAAFASLGSARYLEAVHHAAAVVGNSSSGIIEAPSLGVPTLDIGERQRGRVRAPSVLHCAAEPGAIARGLAEVLSPPARALAVRRENPYAGRDTAARIVDVLAGAGLDGALMKPFYDLEPARAGRGEDHS